MLLPTKGLSPERALITIGAQILEDLDEPMSISSLWQRCRAKYAQDTSSQRVTFDWFTMALSTLFTLNLVALMDYDIIGRIDAP